MWDRGAYMHMVIELFKPETVHVSNQNHAIENHHIRRAGHLNTRITASSVLPNTQREASKCFSKERAQTDSTSTIAKDLQRQRIKTNARIRRIQTSDQKVLLLKK